MNLRDVLLAEHSKAQCMKVVRWVGSSQQRFDELFSHFTGYEYRVIQRAAWPVSYAVQAHPGLIKKHFASLVKMLKRPGVHAAVKRNAIRLMQDIEIPARFHGDIMNSCFGYIASHTEPAAVKAFSLTVIENLSKSYPGILQELKLIIEERWPYETPAFHSRAKKILRRINKV